MPPPLAEQVEAVTGIAMRDLAVVWAIAAPEQATAALFEVLPSFIDTWSTAVAALAADWYDDLREERNIAGRFTAVIPDLGEQGADELAGWASQAILQPEPDPVLFRSRVEGGAQRRIANASRDTVRHSSVADPKARGWQRRIRGETCTFCRMLATRGGVYTKLTAQFKSHDHCDCYAEPVWR